MDLEELKLPMDIQAGTWITSMYTLRLCISCNNTNDRFVIVNNS